MGTGLTKKQKEALTDKIAGMIKNSPALRMTLDSSVNEMNINQISGELNRIHYWAIGKDLPAVFSFEFTQLGSGTPSPDNIRPIIGFEIDGIGTVYSGALNIESSMLTITRKGVTISTAQGATIRSSDSNSTIFAYNNVVEAGITVENRQLSNMLELYNHAFNLGRPNTFVVGSSGALYMQFANSAASSLEQLEALLSRQSFVAVYILATPETYTLTPQQMLQLLDQL